MDTTMATTSTSTSHSLLRRGARIARSVLTSRKECVENSQVNTCEKPSMSTDATIGIMVAVGVVALVAVFGVLVMLHLRAQRNAKAEFANDHHDLSDYGLDEIPAKKGGKSGHLQQPTTQMNRLSAQELVEAQNPFGAGAELSDTDKMSSRGSPPKYPDAVKM
ncbi:hypothetical protein J7T55_010850 [Diaporthe amygdali]|uniref:uncharacterized protein n=1 Tax=Phomopsis amygdali TaxID=1214568 RepID=UPI0022FDE785|nr:uncharacterized protein J7T55_010850 [Diaporthe amygdali]KAJ0114460.1 hypothetical protein J7T55_010850 [Diaporthe amygdali]